MEAFPGSQITQIRSPCRQLSCHIVPRFKLELAKHQCRNRVSMNISSKISYSVSASAKPTGNLTMNHFDNTTPSKEVLEKWRDADDVCFDVDGNVCIDEGIDDLAGFCGAGKAVAEWTARANGGSIPFKEALAARLNLFTQSLSQVQDFLEKRPPVISPGIAELVTKLKSHNTNVYFISGGFRQLINGFHRRIYLLSCGKFVGFDAKEPTSRSGGMVIAVEQIRKVQGYKTLVMIGDGSTDLQARQPGGANIFICYGGVKLRDGVAHKADWLVFNFRELINSLN